MQLRSGFGSLLVISITMLLLAAGFYVYGTYKAAKAGRLLNSAAQIHTLGEARVLIESWKDKVDRYDVHDSPDGSRTAYQLEFSNGVVGWTRVFPSTGITVQVILGPNELDEVLIGMYSDNSSVWSQEEFYPQHVTKFDLNIERKATGNPLKAVIMFGSELPISVRQQSFQLQEKCFFRYGGCRYASDMLPTLPELERRFADVR